MRDIMKISPIEIKNIKKQLDFYNFKEFRAVNKGFLIHFRKGVDIIRYADIELGGKQDTYIAQRECLTHVMLVFFEKFLTNEIYIIKHNSKWLLHREIDPLLDSMMKKENIPNSFRGGITEHRVNILKAFIFANFEGNTLTSFILLNSNIIVIPTDHMDIFVFARERTPVKITLKNILSEMHNSDMTMSDVMPLL